MFAVGHLTADTKWPYFNKKTGEIDGDFAVHQVEMRGISLESKVIVSHCR